MPEITGVVTAKSEKGIMIDQLGERWANWSNFEYRGTPFVTDVKKGDVVCVTYTEKEWPDGGKSLFISVIDRVTQSRDVTPPVEVPFYEPPPPGWGDTPQAQPAPREWGFEQKDKLMLAESCIKAASTLYAASIAAHGIPMPPPEEFGDYWRAVRKQAMETL